LHNNIFVVYREYLDRNRSLPDIPLATMNDDINDGTNYSDDNGSYARLSQAYIEPNLPYNIEETKA